MRIQSVKIKNFRGFGENPLDEKGFYIFKNLDSDLTLIAGNNGYGKTSFFEAIEWALTDNVTRIKKYNEVYNANTLQSKQNLKFISPDAECKKDREINVIVTFSDGITVCRKSNSNNIKTSEKSNYYSTIFCFDKDKKISTKDLLELGYPDFETNSFLKNHFLMQENVSAFFRTTKPRDRKELVMELLNIDELNDLYHLADELIKGNKFTEKENELDNKKADLSSKKDEIDDAIALAGFKSVTDYQTGFNLLISSLINAEKNRDQEVNDLVNEIKNYNDSTDANFKKTYAMLESLKSTMEVKNESIKSENINFKAIEIILSKYKSKSKLKQLLERAEKLQVLQNMNIIDVRTKMEIKTHQKRRLDKYVDYLIEENEKSKSNLIKYIIKSLETTKKISEINEIKESISQFISKKDMDSIFKGFNHSDIDSTYKKLVSDIETFRLNKVKLENTLKYSSDLNMEYNDLLRIATTYIQNQKLENCPVCLNADFKDDKYNNIDGLSNMNNNESLLAIISKIRSKGNKEVEDLVREIKEITAKHNKSFGEKKNIEQQINTIIEKINKKIDENKSKYDSIYTEKHSRVISIKSKVEIKEEELKNKIKVYERYKKELKIEYRINLEEEVLLIRKEIAENRKEHNLSEELSTFDIESTLAEKKLTLTIKYDYKFKGDEIMESISNIQEKQLSNDKLVKSNQVLLDELSNMKNYSLSDRQFDGLKSYFELDGIIKEIVKDKGKLEGYKITINGYRDEINKSRTEYINKLVIDQPIIKWIYSMINPHKYYRDINVLNAETSFNVTDDDNRVFLDHIFSSAQTNILSLSIFLGMGLSFRTNKLDNLLIDDPIQSLDDVNVLSLIDIFRALPKSDYNNVKLIISSHDDRFSQLLSIKMRNHDFTHYQIEDYTKEGPVIKLLS